MVRARSVRPDPGGKMFDQKLVDELVGIRWDVSGSWDGVGERPREAPQDIPRAPVLGDEVIVRPTRVRQFLITRAYV